MYIDLDFNLIIPLMNESGYKEFIDMNLYSSKGQNSKILMDRFAV